jgi:hypothetical protein
VPGTRRDVVARRVGEPAPLLDVEDQLVVGDELQRPPVLGGLELHEQLVDRRQAVDQHPPGLLGADQHQRVQVAVVAGHRDAHEVESGGLCHALGDRLEGVS